MTADQNLDAGLPIRLLHDRVLVQLDGRRGRAPLHRRHRHPGHRRRRQAPGLGHRGGVGPNVRAIVSGDRVLFDPDDRSEVELHGRGYVLLRERDVHAVAAERVETEHWRTGLYL